MTFGFSCKAGKFRKDEVSWEDPVVADVRKVREALLAEAGYDLNELSRRLREKQALSGRSVVSRSPRLAKDSVSASG